MPKKPTPPLALVRCVEKAKPFAGDLLWIYVGDYPRTATDRIELACTCLRYDGVTYFWSASVTLDRDKHWVGICPRCSRVWWATRESKKAKGVTRNHDQ